MYVAVHAQVHYNSHKAVQARSDERWRIAPSEVTPLEKTSRGPKKIARGSFASVHKAVFKERIAAVKELHEDSAQKPGAIALLVQEITINRSITHPNICAVYGGWDNLDLDQGIIPSIVMEYLPLKLTDVMAAPDEYGLTPAAKQSIVYQLAKCLMNLHARRPAIYHCDLKPENIMLTENLTAKLIDFGIAKLERVTKMSKLDGKLASSVQGTFGYMVRFFIFSSSTCDPPGP